MAVTVDIDLAYEFTVKAPFKDVFDKLSDVPAGATLFPKVDRLVDMGDGVYRWEMQKVGSGQLNIQTIYASKYVANKAKGTVVWTPVKGEGNALIGGSWKMTDLKKNTLLELKVNGKVDVPVPGVMKMVVAPVVSSEFENMVEKYIDNVVKQFGGEA